MNYKAKNVDTDKALEHIEWSRKYQDEAERLALAKTQKYYEGVRKGLDIAEEIFTCANYEKDEEPTYADDVLDVIYEYLRSHIDIILAEDINPLNIVAYSYVRKCDNRTMTAFYCDLGEDMYYTKEFMTFHHICKGKNQVKKFMEQQEFKYENPQEIQGYVPHFKNMYKCVKPSDWLYADHRYVYAVG